jgi:hypothetical protein
MTEPVKNQDVDHQTLEELVKALASANAINLDASIGSILETSSKAIRSAPGPQALHICIVNGYWVAYPT